MKFRTQFQRTRSLANPGSPIKTNYSLRIDKFGKHYLEASGFTNTFEFIQSFHDSTEVHKLIEKYSMLGDPSLFQNRSGSYGDFTNLPTTLADVYRSVAEANDFFKSLPIEIKREFNHSPSEFFASIGTEKYNSVLASLNKDKSTVSSKEVSSNESQSE